jgi:pyruvate, orthophosphate dikinase
MQAQGEVIVSGVRTPEPISKLKLAMPSNYTDLMNIADKLERHFAEMQDMEFTIESGRLYILQTITGKRTGNAAVKIAIYMINEGLITR